MPKANNLAHSCLLTSHPPLSNRCYLKKNDRVLTQIIWGSCVPWRLCNGNYDRLVLIDPISKAENEGYVFI
jgi:hypothetical protein